jgi:hypothetical protein
MGDIDYSEVKKLSIGVYQPLIISDDRFLEISFTIPGYYTGMLDEDLSSKILKVRSYYGPVTILFDEHGALRSVIVSSSGEAFDPRAVTRRVTLATISFAEIRRTLFERGDEYAMHTVGILFSDPAVPHLPVHDVLNSACPYGLVDIALAADGSLAYVEVY